MFYTPKQPISDEDLLIVHTQRYLNSLRWSWTIGWVTEVPQALVLPNMLLQSRLLNPMRWATQGTVDAAFLALKNQWAINIGGGYHHAERDRGMGFCVYGDIQLAVEKVWKKYPNYHILIVDLDAHRGNGHEDYFKDTFNASDRKVHIFDMYNDAIYPGSFAPTEQYIDKPSKRYEGLNIKDNKFSKDFFATGGAYLKKLKKQLPSYIKNLIENNKQPNLIIYNAGTDVFAEDTLGQMPLTKEDIITRDTYVFQLAQKQNIPIVMVTSGGYTYESAEIVADSIKAIVEQKKTNLPK